ncbi:MULTISPECIES: GNAT family N-acetyltransferase [Sphingomonas]|jgi:RimJ/RimL family protein N-acetyltransferase|uniref:GNAT family N-acetyltransferase n=1 Tax=Sphingomonas TaxID=13687 RepID=UPI000A9E4E7F|nr:MULTISPECIES: GNAT family N-acetyltransferase [Sphingomonas]WCP71156.1 GNAT family N-acetyltransferase [Sphingomonas hankookensis]
MFARTERLTLRPGWTEDVPALHAAMGHEAVVRNLSRAPWPYTLSDAEAFVAGWQGNAGPTFLIFAHDRGRCDLIGGIGIGPLGDVPHMLGYWITPSAWGRGYATEAGRAALDIAATLGIGRVEAGHYVDNPASGAVLRRLGFAPTGTRSMIHSRGRGAEVETVDYAIDLSQRRRDWRLAA